MSQIRCGVPVSRSLMRADRIGRASADYTKKRPVKNGGGRDPVSEATPRERALCEAAIATTAARFDVPVELVQGRGGSGLSDIGSAHREARIEAFEIAFRLGVPRAAAGTVFGVNSTRGWKNLRDLWVKKHEEQHDDLEFQMEMDEHVEAARQEFDRREGAAK